MSATSSEVRAVAILSFFVITAVLLPPHIAGIKHSDICFMLLETPTITEESAEVKDSVSNSGSSFTALQGQDNVKPLEKIGASAYWDTLDINIASAIEFESLPGIGPVLSKRIVKFRDRLGGFYSIEQVGETYGLDSVVFNHLIPHFSLNISHRKIAMDTASFKSLLRHPYLEFDHVKLIKSYNFREGDDILQQLIDAGLPPSLALKVSPYLVVSTVYHDMDTG